MTNYARLSWQLSTALALQLGGFPSQNSPKRASELWLFCLQLEVMINTNIRLSLNFAEPKRKSFIKKIKDSTTQSTLN